jgi:transposase-like protein
LLNRTHHRSDLIALVVPWRQHYCLNLRDWAEMFTIRSIVFSHEAVREWEAKLALVLAGELRQRRRRKSSVGRRSWQVDKTYLKSGAAGTPCIRRSAETAISLTPC